MSYISANFKLSPMKAYLLSLSFVFITFSGFAQQASTPSENKLRRVKVTERAMLIKNIIVADKNEEFVMVDGKQYKWFPDRTKAIEYFKNMTLKQDMITVYIDTNLPDSKEPD